MCVEGGNAVISLIFAEYLNRLFWHSTRAEVSPDDIPQWAIKLTAVGAIVTVTILCVATKKLGTHAAVVFTTIKVKFVPEDVFQCSSETTDRLCRLLHWCVVLL
jgi:hypothetical protein